MFSEMLMMFALVTAPPSAARASQWFVSKEYRLGLNAGDGVMQYRLYIPPDASTDNKLPILLWFHGHGESGSDNVSQLRYMDTVFNALDGSPPMFILVPQQPAVDVGEVEATSDGRAPATPDNVGDLDFLATVKEIVDQTIKNNPVDADRLYVSGISSGGRHAWDFACRYPGIIAALAPLASDGGDFNQVRKLAKIPIWAFHSENDLDLPSSGVRQTVAAIQASGGSARLTITPPNPAYTHDCWTTAFHDYDLATWLLWQKRGAPPEMSEPVEPFKWWQLLAWSGLGTILLFASYTEHRRRRRAQNSAIS